MQTYPIEHLISLVEEAITEAGVHVSDELGGGTSTPRKHESARVMVESSINTDQTRNQDVSRMVDIIEVQLAFQLRPSGQRLTRNAGHVTSRVVRNKITFEAANQLAESRPIHLTTVPDIQGEWFTITDRYRFYRFEEVGRP